MVEVWVAVSDKLSWGRGYDKEEAVFRAIRHGGRDVESVQLYMVFGKVTQEEVYIDEKGLHFPDTCKMTDKGKKDAKELTTITWEFLDRVV